jgi:hypothetical protein
MIPNKYELGYIYFFPWLFISVEETAILEAIRECPLEQYERECVLFVFQYYTDIAPDALNEEAYSKFEAEVEKRGKLTTAKACFLCCQHLWLNQRIPAEDILGGLCEIATREKIEDFIEALSRKYIPDQLQLKLETTV